MYFIPLLHINDEKNMNEPKLPSYRLFSFSFLEIRNVQEF